MIVRILLVMLAAAAVGIGLGFAGTIFELGARPAGELVLEAATATDGSALHPVEGPRPKVHVDSRTHHFGIMERDTTLKHDFIFTNRGDAPLTLIKGQTSCKCTLSELAQNSIAPGESAAVTLEWTAYTNEHDFRQTAVIETNDPEQRSITLTVEGRVSYSHRLLPSALVFGEITANSPHVVRTRLYSLKANTIEILSHRFAEPTAADHFEVTITPIAKEELNKDDLGDEDAQSGVLIAVSAKPGLPVGPFYQRLLLTTNLKTAPQIEIPVQGRVVGDLTISGRNWNDEIGVLELGTIRSSEGAKAELSVVAKGPYREAVDLKVVKVTPDFLKVTVGKPRTIGKAVTLFPLTIEIPPGSPAANFLGSQQGKLGNIILDTGHPETPQLRMHLRMVVEGN